MFDIYVSARTLLDNRGYENNDEEWCNCWPSGCTMLLHPRDVSRSCSVSAQSQLHSGRQDHTRGAERTQSRALMCTIGCKKNPLLQKVGFVACCVLFKTSVAAFHNASFKYRTLPALEVHDSLKVFTCFCLLSPFGTDCAVPRRDEVARPTGGH